MNKIDNTLLRVYTQAISIFEQGEVLLDVYKDLEIHWERLKTTEGVCVITEQMGTNLKRLLVKKYVVEAVKQIRNIIGLDLATTTIDNVEGLWRVDYMISVLADNKIESHSHLLKEVLASIFGISGRIVNFIFSTEKTKMELYRILSDLYDITTEFYTDDEIIELEYLKEHLNAYILTGTSSVFKLTENVIQ